MNLPELNFIDVDAESLLDNAKKICEGILNRELGRADPLLIFLKSMIAIIIQQELLIDQIAKQNLLYYSTGNALEHLGALVGVQRLAASTATCTCNVTLSAAMTKTIIIPQGTRVTSGDNVYFALDNDLIFLPGEVEKSAKFTCAEVGEVGNNYQPGTLKKIVDPKPFLLSIVNITSSDGGADVEDDESLRQRIAIAPESFSTAGPTGAYEYFTKQASNLITDVAIFSENPGEVDVYFLQEGGNLPSPEVIALVEAALNDRTVRPLTDFVVVKSPEIISYDINLTYYISIDDSSSAALIQEKVTRAVDDFILWQKSKIGRDINKTELEYRIRLAGAKRVEIISPAFQVIEYNQVAVCNEVNLNFAGLEIE